MLGQRFDKMGHRVGKYNDCTSCPVPLSQFNLYLTDIYPHFFKLIYFYSAILIGTIVIRRQRQLLGLVCSAI